MTIWQRLPAVHAGDSIAVLSPSWCAPAHYPDEHDQALQRIRDLLGLVPVEFPTTRRQGTATERAADLMAAFADPQIKAIFATIGGDDQLTVVPHLDPEIVRANPKPFFGYSDNTNLLSWLYFHGVPGVHGGSTQVHLGPGAEVNPLHLQGLRAALAGGDLPLVRPDRMSERGLRWGTGDSLTGQVDTYPAPDWTWSGPARTVRGRTWGGNLEILQWVLGVSRWVPHNDDLASGVLLVETSEEVPPPDEVYRGLRVLGERGLLRQFDAIVWARPMLTDDRSVPGDPKVAAQQRAAYRDVVQRAAGEYNPDAVLVTDVDFGHTIPQLLLPYGGDLTVDGRARTMTAHFDRG